ncbi:hypothetical protein [Massilia genomosp. 1]|uniref:Uncharacterized protein n=1 Tax=Massilia genomosp. 1 TaxID=2609280 RepID=A0ABX0MMW1_9BURK|nr:hypothetical protein [Massilia genomosp. 1]NHZ64112.1 hypothetical protein [Massilia genomosp. 1]
MKRFIPAIVAMFAAGAALAAPAVDKDSYQFGVVSGAAKYARLGTFNVVKLCETRFSDLEPEGEGVRTAWLDRNAKTEGKMAALATRLRAKIQARNPEVDLDQLMAEADKLMRPAALDATTKLITEKLDAPNGSPRALCQSIFAEIKQGKMDIARIQVAANKVLAEAEVADFLDGYKGYAFQDSGSAFQATGTWAGLAFPLNDARITADKGTGQLRVSTATLVALGALGPPFVSTSEDALAIETWDDDVIRTQAKRAGTSQRFFQYVVDRKEKTVTLIFSGQSPKTHVLGDATAQVREMKAGAR